MASVDENERLDGPGFRDRLRGLPNEPWMGEDGLKLKGEDARDARRAWHAVLTSHLNDFNGRSADAMAGRLGWFELRLTRKDVNDLIRSAAGARLIELEPDRGPQGEKLADADRRWLLTDKGIKLPAPRGASSDDLLSSVINTARRTVSSAKDLSVVAAFIVTGGLGWTIAKGSLLAHILLVFGIWAFVAALVIGSYRDERALTACAEAWPRLRDYRPARFALETYRWHSPRPAALLGFATVGAAVGMGALAHHEHKLPNPWWTVALVASVAVAVLIFVGLWLLQRRAKPVWQAYWDELRRRKPLPYR